MQLGLHLATTLLVRLNYTRLRALREELMHGIENLEPVFLAKNLMFFLLNQVHQYISKQFMRRVSTTTIFVVVLFLSILLHALNNHFDLILFASLIKVCLKALLVFRDQFIDILFGQMIWLEDRFVLGKVHNQLKVAEDSRDIRVLSLL